MAALAPVFHFTGYRGRLRLCRPEHGKEVKLFCLRLGLAAGLPLLASCVLANYAAGLVVAQVGAAVASPDALREAIRDLPVTITKW